MSSPLTKAIVLITGGNTGLGYATAQALLSSPSPLNKVYTVLLTSRSLTRAQEAAKSLKADKDLSDAFQKGAEVIPLQLDLDDDESIRSIRKEVGDKHGRLDVLVNNAGMCRNLEVTQSVNVGVELILSGELRRRCRR